MGGDYLATRGGMALDSLRRAITAGWYESVFSDVADCSDAEPTADPAAIEQYATELSFGWKNSDGHVRTKLGGLDGMDGRRGTHQNDPQRPCKRLYGTLGPDAGKKGWEAIDGIFRGGLAHLDPEECIATVSAI